MRYFCNAIGSLVIAVLVLSPNGQIIAQANSSTPTPTDSKPIPSAPSAKPDIKPGPYKAQTLLDGTPVKLRLQNNLSSANAKVGDNVSFDVVEEVKVDGIVTIPKGAMAIGTVTVASRKKSMGRTGKLEMNIDYVRLADNEKAALRGTQGGNGGGHVGAMTGAMVATAVVFFPAAPLFLFVHGKDKTIPKGTQITAFVNGDMPLNMAKFGPANGGPAATALSSTSPLVAVDASVANCDIDVDGVFAGNTPSQITMTPGKHVIKVKKKGYETWTRDLVVAGSGVHLYAELEAAVVSADPAK